MGFAGNCTKCRKRSAQNKQLFGVSRLGNLSISFVLRQSLQRAAVPDAEVSGNERSRHVDVWGIRDARALQPSSSTRMLENEVSGKGYGDSTIMSSSTRMALDKDVLSARGRSKSASDVAR